MTKTKEQDDIAAVTLVYDAIRTAASILDAIHPDKILESWEKQETTMSLTDPTGYMKMMAAGDDMRCKKEIIQAAADFLREWNRIKDEALSTHKAEERGG